MKYDFDIIIDRSQNLERKWDQAFIAKNYHLNGDNIINSSIADLDFTTPSPIMDAILARAKKGVYSYSYVSDDLYRAISNLYCHQHKVVVPVDKIKLLHGTVNALHRLIQCLTDVNDYFLIQTPVYGPFGQVIVNNNRRLLANQLQWVGDTYQVDFSMFEATIKNINQNYLSCVIHITLGACLNKDRITKNNYYLWTISCFNNIRWNTRRFSITKCWISFVTII
ncbi:hypothetical protein [Spiroplasma endosymbiont of Phyllotreta cruciferae]|uniref:hypothetical protein n=1 Tax=Spiroplasma endosymbiont of Phyllotreta cruciferae TaxID=2886375 RepID=UPI0020A226B1|nr:hypothetical protein [Spiroplasma endosymbiont of Phyllotreta cruciferae]